MIMLSRNTSFGMRVKMYLSLLWWPEDLSLWSTTFATWIWLQASRFLCGDKWGLWCPVKYGNIGCFAVLHLYGETCVNGIPNEGTQATCLIHRYAAVCTKAEGGHLEHVLWIQQYRLSVSTVFGYKILECFNKDGILHNIKNLHTQCTLDEVKEWW